MHAHSAGRRIVVLLRDELEVGNVGLTNGLPVWLQEIQDRADKATPGPWATHLRPQMVEKMAEVLDKIAWEYAAELGCAYLDDNPDACLACEAHEYCPGCGAAQVLAEYYGTRKANDRVIASRTIVGAAKPAEQQECDFAFIAHARMDMFRLVELVRGMAQALETVKTAFDGLQTEGVKVPSFHLAMMTTRAACAVDKALAEYRGNVKNK